MYKTFVKNNIMFKKRNVVEDNIENYVGGIPVRTISGLIFLVPQPARHEHLVALFETYQIGNIPALPADYIVPGSLNHCGALPVFVGIIRSNGDSYHRVVGICNLLDAPDYTPEFYFVQLFHSKCII